MRTNQWDGVHKRKGVSSAPRRCSCSNPNGALLILSKPWSAPGPGISYLPESEYMARDSSQIHGYRQRRSTVPYPPLQPYQKFALEMSGSRFLPSLVLAQNSGPDVVGKNMQISVSLPSRQSPIYTCTHPWSLWGSPGLSVNP